MENERHFVEKMERRGIKPTAIRLLVLRAMSRGNEAVSLPQLERLLPTVDKSSISRTLSAFLKGRLVHTIDDGSGSVKYNICHDACTCELHDVHAHFYCERCRRTFCLEHIQAPIVGLPEGFRATTVNYVVKGVCPACSSRS